MYSVNRGRGNIMHSFLRLQEFVQTEELLLHKEIFRCLFCFVFCFLFFCCFFLFSPNKLAALFLK